MGWLLLNGVQWTWNQEYHSSNARGPGSHRLAAGGRSMSVDTDFGQLIKTIVHSPGQEAFRVVSLASADHSLLCQDLLGCLAPYEHREFVQALRSEGVQILYFSDLLSDAIANAKADKAFELWLRKEFPHLQPDLPQVLDQITELSLLGGDDLFYRIGRNERGFSPIFRPLKWLFYVRDFAAMTPRGTVLARFVTNDRHFEDVVGRFLFAWSSHLENYPIVFDAAEHDVFLQGGDVIVLDKETLLVGIDNLTERSAAAAIARLLNLDVVGVTLPTSRCRKRKGSIYDDWTSLHTFCLHLDSVLNLLGPHQALAVPYLLEECKDGDNPFLEMLELVRPTLGEASYKRLAQVTSQVGWVVEFEAGTGKQKARDCKIVDYLKQRGFQIVYVGGSWPAREHLAQHFIENVWREFRFQGANVLAVRPGKVVTFEGHDSTHQALHDSGIQTVVVSGHDLAHWWGGPHCMAMPLQRASV
jgi:arginine deiminase